MHFACLIQKHPELRAKYYLNSAIVEMKRIDEENRRGKLNYNTHSFAIASKMAPFFDLKQSMRFRRSSW